MSGREGGGRVSPWRMSQMLSPQLGASVTRWARLGAGCCAGAAWTMTRAGGMMRVLVVDDSDDIREVLGLILKMTGHMAEGVGDGEMALARLGEASFDLILLDLLMPGMGGLEFLEALRGLPAGARAPIILMAAAPERLAALPRTPGVRATLQKPFGVDDLLALIDRVSREPIREAAHAQTVEHGLYRSLK